MIKEKHFTKFEKIFGRSLKPFVTFYGFDVIKFDGEIDTPYGVSTKDHVLKLYGQEGVDLIMEMVDTVQDELNDDLSEVEAGTEKAFLIMETKGFVIHNTIEVTGLIYYPFAIERISKMKWKLHHLPSGYFVKPEILGKKNAVELAKKCQAVSGMSTANYTQEAFNKLSEIIFGE